MNEPRTLAAIAREILADWSAPNFAAVPYLREMATMQGMDDTIGPSHSETGRTMVRYFLGNASSWRGPVARRIKAELRGMVGR